MQPHNAADDGLVNRERKDIEKGFAELLNQPLTHFPANGYEFPVAKAHGVYVLSDGDKILHVGRSVRSPGGLARRLADHLRARSSFMRARVITKNELRDRCSYRCIIVPDERRRALLEALAIGRLCPRHLGLGASRRA